MMDSLILDSLSTTPFALTKITTHRPVKKATSTQNLPSNSNASIRGGFNGNNGIKKIPTQGNLMEINHFFFDIMNDDLFLAFTYIQFFFFKILNSLTTLVVSYIVNSFASSQVCLNEWKIFLAKNFELNFNFFFKFLEFTKFKKN